VPRLRALLTPEIEVHLCPLGGKPGFVNLVRPVHPRRLDRLREFLLDEPDPLQIPEVVPERFELHLEREWTDVLRPPRRLVGLHVPVREVADVLDFLLLAPLDPQFEPVAIALNC
jgi:hypothetical protein